MTHSIIALIFIFLNEKIYNLHKGKTCRMNA